MKANESPPAEEGVVMAEPAVKQMDCDADAVRTLMEQT